MEKNSSNTIEILDLPFVMWKNKFLFLSLAILSLILGLIFFYYNPLQSEGRYYSKVNLLIEDYEGQSGAVFTIDNTPAYSSDKIIESVNKTLSSSYNYENWSNENMNLSNNLTQEKANSFIIDAKQHILKFNYPKEETFESVISYLNFTSNQISKKIVYRMIERGNEDIEQLNQEKDILEEMYEKRGMDLENEMLNKEILLKATRKELEIIDDFIDNKSKNTEEIDPELFLRKSELNNTINIVELLMDNIKKRESLYYNLETELAKQLSTIDIKIRKIEKTIKTGFPRGVINLGRTDTKYIPPKVTNIQAILIISVSISIILSFLTILIKEEYRRRKKFEKI